MDEKPLTVSELEAVPGDTYPLRAELKALGAVWDPARRVWAIAADKLALATALVESQSLLPAPTPVSEIMDPFEQEEDAKDRLVELRKGDGATYETRDALRVVGARWDKTRRSWVIREDRASYARAVLGAVVASPGGTAPQEEETVLAIPENNTPVPLREARCTRGTMDDGAERQSPMPGKATATGVSAVRRRTPAEVPNRIKITGLWLNRSEDGQTFLAGSLSPSIQILVFKNDSEDHSSNQPSHVMYLVPAGREETETPTPDGFFDAPHTDGNTQ